MSDHGRPALHVLCDSFCGVNWRPTRFVDELTLNRYACSVCHVIPSTTVVLPCSHALCEKCVTGCVVQDGRSVCPVDQQPFCEEECQKSHLPDKTKQNLKAHCWNEADGCEFVDTIEAVLLHFDRECAFHAIQCPRCERRILRSDFAAHNVAGCSPNASCASCVQPNRQDGSTPSCDMTVTRNQLSTLQSQMNEVLELCRIWESTRLPGIMQAFSSFTLGWLSQMRQIEGNICSMFTREMSTGLQGLMTAIRDAYSDLLSTLESHENEFVEHSRAHDASLLQEMARLFRDVELQGSERVNRVEANLSSMITDTQQSLLRSIDSLKQSNQSTSAVLILRKMETFANASLSTIDFLRQQINRRHGKPWVSHVSALYDLPRCSVAEEPYSAKLTLHNAGNIFHQNEGDIAGWNQFECRDLFIRLVFYLVLNQQPVFSVDVHCVKMLENSRFPFTTIALSATGNAGRKLTFPKADQHECSGCSRNRTSHLYASFEVTEEQLPADEFIRNGDLELTLDIA